MFSVNSIMFFNFLSAENSVFFEQRCSSVFEQSGFHLNFKLPIAEKIQVLQGFELLNQFFSSRPRIQTVKKFGKSTHFNLKLTLNSDNLHIFLNNLYGIRNSSRRKLVHFKFKSDQLVIAFKDFITLFPFQIRFYDFHSWRHQVTLSYSFFNLSGYEKFVMTSFFASFFRYKVLF